MRAQTLVAVSGLLAAALVAVTAAAQSQGGSFRITREVIAGGGGDAGGGSFQLVGTVAQYAAADQAGGSFRLRGGFHAPHGGTSDGIFADSFEGTESTP